MASSWLEIDLDVVTANARAVRQLAGEGVELFAVVKADGFGHGATPAARAALRGGASALAVAYLEEALRLRADGVTARVIALTPPDLDMVRAAQNQRIEFVVGDPAYVREAGEIVARAPVAVRIHTKVDTGLGRHGVLPEQLPGLLEAIAGQPAFRLVGVCTHTAHAANPEATQEQLERFLEATAAIEPAVTRHFASSAAMVSVPASRLDAIRVGAFLYGLHLGLLAEWLPEIQPALAWRAPLTVVRQIPKGHPVSYGSLFRAERETILGIVPVGYAHGYPHHLSGNSVVIAGGRRVPVIGAVCMDMICVDLTDVPDCRPGDTVTLLGKGGPAVITAEELAEKAQTIPYVMLTGLPGHLRREYVGGQPG